MAPTKLWIPGPRIEDEKAKPYRCLNCGKEFLPGHQSQYIRHTVSCVRKDDSGIRRHMESEKENIFTSHADPEAMEWVRKRVAEGKPAAKKGRPA